MNKEIKFTDENIKDFNLYNDTQLNENMTFEQAISNIEANGNKFFYVSMNKDDVLTEINQDIELSNQLNLDNVYIKGLGIYASIINY